MTDEHLQSRLVSNEDEFISQIMIENDDLANGFDDVQEK